MKNFNINDEIIIYPNEYGWMKIINLISNKYRLSLEEATEWANRRKTIDGGYKDQLWVIIDDLHGLFFHGQKFLQSMQITFLNEK